MFGLEKHTSPCFNQRQTSRTPPSGRCDQEAVEFQGGRKDSGKEFRRSVESMLITLEEENLGPKGSFMVQTPCCPVEDPGLPQI